jgi:hypothetical protein
MSQQYRVMRWCAIVLCLVCGLWISACSGLQGGEPTPTERPWARFRSEDVINALQAVGLSLENLDSNLAAGRGAPLTFSERFTFEIPRIAPNGGQIVIFANQEAMDAWTEWIVDLRNDPETRRDVVYVYTNHNALIQLNAGLTNQEAAAYRDTFLSME